MRVLSYSGGLQSTALLVLAGRRQVRIDAAIHIDLGVAESPDTIRYIRDVAIPYAREKGIHVRIGYVDAVGDILSNPAHPKAPFRDAATKAPTTRQCTNHWKVRVFRRLLRAMMHEMRVPVRRDAVQVLLGISYDETERIKPPDVQYYSHEYPLVDLKLRREDCVSIIEEEGLPVPDKSACWFCPFTKTERFRSICARYPEVAAMADYLQEVISDARQEKGLPELVIVPSGASGDHVSECTGYCLT